MVRKDELKNGVKHISYFHTACLVNAVSKEEALGKGLMISYKAYPEKDGWLNHHIHVSSPNNIIDPNQDIDVL